MGGASDAPDLGPPILKEADLPHHESSDETQSDRSAPAHQENPSQGTAATVGPEPPEASPGLLRRIWEWKPKPARYDVDNPPHFTLSLNLLFSFATTFTVANLYYNQPILNKMADTFHVSFERASAIATLTQSGYAAGLLFICPLGDIFRRRPFILALIAFTATLWIVLCLTDSFTVFAAISFVCGATTVTPQVMLPLVGDLAPPHRRGSAISVVVSGLALGILIARLLSGIVANYTDWRNIYWLAFAAQYLTLALLYVYLPDYPSKNPDGSLGYARALWSILAIVAAEPVLVQASLLTFVLSAVFTCYWTTLSFLLSSPPYDYSSIAIGLFALIGIGIILLGPVMGRLVIDRLVPLASIVGGLLVEMAGLAVGTAVGSHNVAGPILQAVAIDLGGQCAQIAARAAIYGIRRSASNRVNTAYMVASFLGQITGTAAGNRLYAKGGWVYSGAFSIALTGFGLLVCFVRGPRETGWFGWSGGWKPTRDDLPRKREEPASEEPTVKLEQPTEERGPGQEQSKE
ncbi:hypothetical protein VTK73DRAFT_1707 [Phialemonium thermophilum]|uniref:Major facilitator superfamily (MFS) profile domain-containing protein n=1 Tax=Phialemonium thermophilum TaxID=223376 RepID=A0ABR3VT65_9PEZI